MITGGGGDLHKIVDSCCISRLWLQCMWKHHRHAQLELSSMPSAVEAVTAWGAAGGALHTMLSSLPITYIKNGVCRNVHSQFAVPSIAHDFVDQLAATSRCIVAPACIYWISVTIWCLFLLPCACCFGLPPSLHVLGKAICKSICRNPGLASVHVDMC